MFTALHATSHTNTEKKVYNLHEMNKTLLNTITPPQFSFSPSKHNFHLPSLTPPLPLTHPHLHLNLNNRRHNHFSRHLTMSFSGDTPPLIGSHVTELTTESDFEQIVDSDGALSICGFGSLLSERSARSTFPDLVNFRVAKLNGFRRVFAHVAPIFFERGIAKPETKEISSLSVEPCEGESLIVTVFEIKKSEIPSYIEREHEFRFLAVQPKTLEGNQYASPAVLCARYSDEEYFQNRCKGRQDIYHERYGRFGVDKIWRDDVLPCRVYCRHCVLAAKNLGNEVYDNFLDHTYIADRKTTLREYLSTTGSGIMEEEPPELLKVRYGG
ncbi:butirosin biosynthesis, BtrG-like protein [Artemisia annua]|uniref:Butirosin biosynthesis, BtrG-like protein n=1 Tax=Artemisia annua TaxID=35608 RepID=A0A2U1P6J5_ARTAN|nr:butirosin biosynthesis, BtrG-like protein [Artemisia annua]